MHLLVIRNKKTGAFRLRLQCWLVRPDKTCLCGSDISVRAGITTTEGAPPYVVFVGWVIQVPNPTRVPHSKFTFFANLEWGSYAVLLGLKVKSRTCVRMLDICIPFSEDTNGSISAMNGSFINSLISS